MDLSPHIHLVRVLVRVTQRVEHPSEQKGILKKNKKSQ